MHSALFPLLLLATATPFSEPIPLSTAVIFAEDGGAARQSTGVLIDREARWLLASGHAVQDYRKLSVIFPLSDQGVLVTAPLPYQTRLRQGKAIAARVLALDPGRDLALLELASVPESAVAAVFAGAPRAREEVLLIGNPPERNILWERTNAIVLGSGRRSWNYGVEPPVETTAVEVAVWSPLASGYSGGPAFNRKQRLVGVIAAEKEPGGTTIYCVDACALRVFVLETRLTQSCHALEIPSWPR